MKLEVTGALQAAPVLRVASEFCPLPQPSEASLGRNSCASADVCPSHHSLGSGREAKRRRDTIYAAIPLPPGQVGYVFTLCTNVCVCVGCI